MAQSRGKSTSRRKGGKRASARSGSSWPWIAALLALGGGIVLYDNSAPARRFLTSLSSGVPAQTAAREEPRAKPAPAKPQVPQAQRSALPASPVPPLPVGAPDQNQTAAIKPPAPIGKPVGTLPLQPEAKASVTHNPGPGPAGGYEAKFFLCGTAKQDDCVASADRFVFHGQKIRLVGIEVPDIKKPRCEAERIKASDAELRVRAFLDSGPFELVTWQGNDAEIDGHKLRDVTRNGKSLADVLVSEGLAKRPGSGKSSWCS